MSAPRVAYLICYDISGAPRRLARVHRFLSRRALAIHYSVFLAVLTRRERAELLRDLGRLIHPRRDDVRLYPIPARPLFEFLGRRPVPEGVLVAGVPRAVGRDEGGEGRG